MKWATIKEASEAIKNLCTLILFVVITLFFIFVAWPKIKDFEVKKISFAGTELGPKEKQALNIIESVPTNVTTSGKDSGAVNFKVLAAAKLVDTTINAGTQSWVYIGQIINGKLNTHFRITKIPQQGDVITAIDAVYKRKELPVELKNGNWKLAEIKGAVADNESVKVSAVQKLRDDNYWALVR